MARLAKAEGELVLTDGKGGVEKEFYEEEFIFDDAVKTKEQARSMLHAGLLTERLKTRDNFKRWRTCDVVEFKETTKKAENSELDRILLEATSLGCVPEGIENYKRPDYKIKALQNAIDKHKSRMEKQKKSKDNVQDLGYVD